MLNAVTVFDTNKREHQTITRHEYDRRIRYAPNRWVIVEERTAATTVELAKRDYRRRIVHVTPWPLYVGGIQRMIDSWCTHAAAAWDCHVIAPRHDGLKQSLFEFAHATVHEGYDSGAATRLIEKLQPDLIVYHNATSTYGRSTCAPCVWVVHGPLVFREAKPNWTAPAAVLSNYVPAEFGPGWDQAEVTPIRLGVDVHRFRPRRLVAGIVGRLSAEKIPPAWIEALREWDNPGGKWTLRIVGVGQANAYQGDTHRALDGYDWIEFVADVTPANMPAALHALDVLLVPSERESGSYAIVEALACGVPVIARNVDGIPYTTEGCAGVVLVDDEAGFFAALKVLETAKERTRAGKAARAWAEQEATIERHAYAQSEAYRLATATPLPSIDVLMPVWNTPAQYLREAWESILAQTYRPARVVCVDDGSTEQETIDLLGTIGQHPLVTLIRREKNGGVSAALNDGLEHCSAEYVARMDADDIMRPFRLELQANYLVAHAQVDVLGGQIEWTDKPGMTEHPSVVTIEYAERSNWFINHPTVVFKAAVVREVGGYNPRWKTAQDLGLWLRLLSAGRQIHNLQEVVLRYRTHAGQVTAKNDRAATIGAIRAELKRPDDRGKE